MLRALCLVATIGIATPAFAQDDDPVRSAAARALFQEGVASARGGAASYCDLTSGCTVAPTFTEIYTSILATRCAPCHVTNPPRSGTLDLGTVSAAYAAMVGTTATCGGGVNTRVVPGDSGRSLLWRKVAGVDLCGSRMPRMSTPLTAEQIAAIAHWIEAGALE